MARRSTLLSWAISGQWKDPDLDAAHPGLTGGTNKYINGWIVEKEPHQWANFLYQGQTDFQLNCGQCGTPDVAWLTTQKSRAIAWQNKSQKVHMGGGVWHDSLSNMAATDFTTAVTENTQNLADHAAITFAHALTAEQVGTFTKQVIDTLPIRTSIPNHTTATNNPHAETALQIGSVPNTGGTFTGEVSFTTVKIWTNVFLSNQTFGEVGKYFKLYEDALTLRASSTATGSVEVAILTPETFPWANTKYNPLYAPPEPASKWLTNGSVYSADSFGDFDFVQGTGGAMNINSVGLLLEAGNTYTHSDLLLLKAGGTYTAEVDGVFASFRGAINSTDLVALFGVGKRIKELSFWSVALTDRQLAHLKTL